jgi:hypothetical protein
MVVMTASFASSGKPGALAGFFGARGADAPGPTQCYRPSPEPIVFGVIAATDAARLLSTLIKAPHAS